MTEISHCPFCAGTARLFESNHFPSERAASPSSRVSRWRVTCTKCKAYGPSKETRNDAIFHWNVRQLWPLGDSGLASTSLIGGE